MGGQTQVSHVLASQRCSSPCKATAESQLCTSSPVKFRHLCTPGTMSASELKSSSSSPNTLQQKVCSHSLERLFSSRHLGRGT